MQQKLPLEKMFMALTCLLSTEHGPMPFNNQVGDPYAPCPKLNLTGITARVNSWETFNDIISKRIDSDIQALANKIKNMKSIKEESCIGDGILKQLQIDKASAAISVYCESNKYGKNWLLIGNIPQNSNLLDFYAYFENGFGDLTNKQQMFFIGLQKLIKLTSNTPHELLGVLLDDNNLEHYIYFSHFIWQNNNGSLAIPHFLSDVKIKSITPFKSNVDQSSEPYDAMSIKSAKIYLKAKQ